MLRAPFIEASKHWISSISVCIRAAQMLLSVYLQIYKPSAITPDQPADPTTPFPPQFLQVDNSLPLTWRQVKRITTSALVIVYAHWNGEASHEEACRGVATALLLLKCQRIRWRDEIDMAVKSLYELAKLSDLKIEAYLITLLPGANMDFLRSVAGDQAGGRYNDVQVRFLTQTASTSGSWHLFEPVIPLFDSIPQVDGAIYGAACIEDMYGLPFDGQTMDDSTWVPGSPWSNFGDI